ncbi:hypothetical protein PybrP1_004205 [[Pythium] brassicae (nom. inval.)]|nr:hypothetical protein PybrP1_004205 [[Pythium] brassicae (nom. inval.)]
MPGVKVAALAIAVVATTAAARNDSRGARAEPRQFKTKSGIGVWVDPDTPEDRQPDGVNAALEIYAHDMTSTACDADGTCYFYIKSQDEVNKLTVWNDYINPPGYQNVTFYYRAAMVQSWNKFCFQGGMVEVSTKLPGIVDADSGNPDVAGGPSARVKALKYYPTWPGIWMMGNLGRAIFSASNTRMWPFSYNECNDKVFKSSNQRISACDADPGHGLNPNQGRGAPEIDIIEGAGNEISTSMQVGPGMPRDFRIIYPSDDPAPGCVYTGTCKTQGANTPDVPAEYYASLRDHKTWYQGMKYAANNFCGVDSKLKQDALTVKATVTAGVTENACTLTNCPASRDVNGDLGLIDGSNTDYWGINSNGTCFSFLNGYTGSYLCSPGNPSPLCEKTDIPQSDKVTVFEYQMDALSANWQIHLAAYTDYLVYQLEWVMGPEGYVRWMLAGQPIYEIPASSITNPPQDAAKSNPVKIMVEEPMYMIFNVALSSTWGNGTDPITNKICDSFPMYLKIDYIRVYQDTSAGSKMQWIQDHIESYQDYDNLAIDVSGKAFCRTDNDCTIASSKTVLDSGESFGPSLTVAIATFGTALLVTLFSALDE